MKILGFGIDLDKMDRFDSRVSGIDTILIKRFLTDNEYLEYKKITTIKGQVRFLCSHWVAKEAVYKALQTSNRPLDKIEISRLPNGHLTYVSPNPSIEGLLSITYSENYCAAACILIQNDESCSFNLLESQKILDTISKKINFHQNISSNNLQESLNEEIKKLTTVITNFSEKLNEQTEKTHKLLKKISSDVES